MKIKLLSKKVTRIKRTAFYYLDTCLHALWHNVRYTTEEDNANNRFDMFDW